MTRFAIAAFLAVAVLTGCADPKQATYSCRPDVSNRVAPAPATPPMTDAAGDKTCE